MTQVVGHETEMDNEGMVNSNHFHVPYFMDLRGKNARSG